MITCKKCIKTYDYKYFKSGVPGIPSHLFKNPTDCPSDGHMYIQINYLYAKSPSKIGYVKFCEHEKLIQTKGIIID